MKHKFSTSGAHRARTRAFLCALTSFLLLPFTTAQAVDYDYTQDFNTSTNFTATVGRCTTVETIQRVPSMDNGSSYCWKIIFSDGASGDNFMKLLLYIYSASSTALPEEGTYEVADTRLPNTILKSSGMKTGKTAATATFDSDDFSGSYALLNTSGTKSVFFITGTSTTSVTIPADLVNNKISLGKSNRYFTNSNSKRMQYSSNSATTGVHPEFSFTLNVVPAEAAAAGCTATGSGTYAYGSSVSCAATPAAGWMFASWEWKNDQRTPQNFSVNGTTPMEAYFVPTGSPTYTMTLATYEGKYGTQYWTKDVMSTQSGYYGKITMVTIQNGQGNVADQRGAFYEGEHLTFGTQTFGASDASNGKFVKWSNGSRESKQHIVISTNAADRVLTAYYVDIDAPERTITLLTSGSGTATGDGDYYDDVPAFLTAVPDDGATFDHWENGSGENVSTDNPYKFTVSGNATYTAVFSGGSAPTPTYTITWVDGDGNEIYHETVDEGDIPAFDDRTTPTKTQTDEYTYAYNGTWSPTPYAANDNQTYTAQFNATKRQYTITVTSAGNGTVSGGGTYEYGASASLTATPDNYYSFSSWTDGGAQNHSVTVTGTATYTASFTLNTSVSISDNESGSSYYSTLLSTYNGTSINARINRTFKAGMWNTVCFPFDLTSAQRGNSDMSGVTFYTLTSVTGDAAVGLDFNVTAVTTETMTARTPYLVQFTGADIVNPVFEDVTLAASAFTNNTSGSDLGDTKFFGTVHPTALEIGQSSGFLFLGQNNNLYWPNVNNDIRAFRAYFYSGSSEVQSVHPRARIVVRGETPTDIEERIADGNGSALRKYLHNGVLVIEKNGIRYNAVGQVIE